MKRHNLRLSRPCLAVRSETCQLRDRPIGRQCSHARHLLIPLGCRLRVPPIYNGEVSLSRQPSDPTIRYVEKKTCEFAVQAARIADIPWTIGAGFAEIGFTFESLTSSSSTLRCSCGWGWLVYVIV